MNKKRRTITFLLIAWTVINLIAGSLLFIDIQIFKAPKITATIKIAEINEEEASVEAIINISNPNIFGLSTRNFEIITTTPDGEEVIHTFLEGGDIGPNEEKSFETTAYVRFENNSPETLTSKITGDIGISVAFIKKTIPITVSVITSVEEIMETLAAPKINMHIEFGELTQKGLNLTGTIEAYNPNSFDIIIGDISGKIKAETGKNVGNLEIRGGVLKSGESLELESNGTILLDALNYKTITINIDGMAGARIAGINETVPISIEVDIKVPDLSNLLAPNIPTDVLIIGDYRLSLRGLIDDLTLEIDNPNKIDIEAKDILVSIFYVNAGEKTFVGETSLEEGIVKAQSREDFCGQLVIPYSKLLTMTGKRLLPDQMLITIRANVTIPGINQTIWVGVTGCQDFRFFN